MFDNESRHVILPFPKGVVHPNLEMCVLPGPLHLRRDTMELGRVQQRANEKTRVVGQLPPKGKLKGWANSGI